MPRTKLFMYGSLLAAVAAAAGAAYSIARNTPVTQARDPVSQPAFRPGDTGVAPPGDGPRGDMLGAIGLVEPFSEPIAIGSTAAGVVSAVAARPGDRVVKGDVLFVIDDRAAVAEVGAAREELRAAEARLRETEAQAEPAEARVAAAAAAERLARVELAEREQQLRRIKALGGAASAEEADQRRYAVEAAAARLADVEAKLREGRANLALLKPPPGGSLGTAGVGPTVEVQRAAVAKAKAALAQAEVRVVLHTVRAPITGTVLQVRVRVGEFVPTAVLSDPLMVLGVINPLHVRVEIDEAEIGRFSPDARAVASLRGQPDRRNGLTFLRVEPLVIPKRVLTGATSERVDTRVLQVVYALDPDAQIARPGQQVDVYIQAGPPSANR